MKTELVGHLMAFKRDDQVADRAVLVEVTDQRAGGVVELAIDMQAIRMDRLYLSIPLPDLVRIALTMKESDA